MRSIIAITSILAAFCSCKPAPTYNPVDPIFDVDVSKLVEDNCDTISAGCGYYNLSKNFGQYSVYYQTYMDEPDQVVAKGMTIYLDTIFFEYDMDHETDSLYYLMGNTPIDTAEIDNLLTKYGLTRVERNELSKTSYYSLWYEDPDGNKFGTSISGDLREKGQHFRRQIDLFNSGRSKK